MCQATELDQSVQQKFHRTREELSNALVERDQEVDLLLTSLICRENPLLIGPPGTGKSMLIDTLLSWMQGRKFSILWKVVLAFGVESYLKMVQSEGRSKKTYSKYKQVLNQFKGLLEKRGAKYLNQINPTDFDDYRINRKVNKSPKTIYTEAVVIKQFLKFCKSRKLIPENPLAELRLSKPKANKKNTPSLI